MSQSEQKIIFLSFYINAKDMKYKSKGPYNIFSKTWKLIQAKYKDIVWSNNKQTKVYVWITHTSFLFEKTKKDSNDWFTLFFFYIS